MDRTYWHQQTAEEALFADLLWSRPENKRLAGKLLVIGGSAHGFAAPAAAYAAAETAGAGITRVLLPDYLQKTVGKLFPGADFAASTPTGGFSRQALGELLDLSSWSDGVLIAGDLGRNSETAILMEHFAQEYKGQLTITRGAADQIVQSPGPILARTNTTMVISFGQLQKLGQGARWPVALTSTMGLLRLIDTLHEFTKRYSIKIVTRLNNTLVAAVGGQISTTPMPAEQRVWRLAVAVPTAVWWLQNPARPFEAITTACFLASGTAGRT